MKLGKFKIIIIVIPHHFIGGAERVHLNIIKSLKSKPIVLFDCSSSKDISKEFSENAYCFLVTNHKRIKFTIHCIKIVSYFLPVTIFGCNSSLFYRLIGKLKKKVKSIDLTHAFSCPENGVEISSLPYIDLIDTRVVINKRTFADYKKLYELRSIDKILLKRFKIIPNGVEIRKFLPDKIDSRFSDFTVGFVGRNSSEKRPELFFKIVEKIKFRAKVIGDSFDNFKNDFPDVIYFENCNNPELIRKEFSDISVLIVTSSREGFPLVIMEAMEMGIPVISTNVGSIEDHLINKKNGYLIDSKNENEFLNSAVDKISEIYSDKELYREISLNAREHASKCFNIEVFKKNYQQLFYE